MVLTTKLQFSIAVSTIGVFLVVGCFFLIPRIVVFRPIAGSKQGFQFKQDNWFSNFLDFCTIHYPSKIVLDSSPKHKNVDKYTQTSGHPTYAEIPKMKYKNGDQKPEPWQKFTVRTATLFIINTHAYLINNIKNAIISILLCIYTAAVVIFIHSRIAFQE